MVSDGPVPGREPARGGTSSGAAPRRRGRRTDDPLRHLAPGPGPDEPATGESDPWAARARELHRKAAEADAMAARIRAERDEIVHRLRAQDAARWSYSNLAAALGCSRELVALIARRSPR